MNRKCVRAAGAVAAAIVVAAAAATAQAAVEYVRICSVYGAGFHYHPGFDVCLNVATNDARVPTERGTWRWRVPNNPREWVSGAKKACKGKLIEVGEFSSANLALNVYGRYQGASGLPLALEPGQYVSSVIYQGGFTGVGRGNFCLFWHYYDPTIVNDVPIGDQYTPIGCIDTFSMAGTPLTAAFVPDTPLPPATTEPVTIVAANGDLWSAPEPDDIGGALTASVCVQKAKQ
ncbi:MAG TPA: porin [Candidatus Limnocylindrales bacterium]|nr:porin [Candidatus Limnocylindrales bacterium]